VSAIPESSVERLKEIVDLDVLSPDVDPILQDAVREAAERLNLPKALVTVVLDEAQFFAAKHGVTGWMAEAGGTPVEWSFCANAVRSGEPFVVEDATTHPLVHDNPLVTLEGIRCYAGIPLVTTRGHALGTLCVIGDEPRSFGESDMATLREIADRTVATIEARRKPDASEALAAPPAA